MATEKHQSRLTRTQYVDQCPLTDDQLGCNCPDCDGCLIMAEVLGKIPTLNARIEAGVREIYNRYSPSWQHTRNQPGSKF